MNNSKEVPQSKYYLCYYRKIQLQSWITVYKPQIDAEMEHAIHTYTNVLPE